MAEKVPRSPEQLWSRLQEVGDEDEPDLGEVRGLLQELEQQARRGHLPENMEVGEMFEGVSSLTPEQFVQFCSNQLRTVEELQRRPQGKLKSKSKTRRRK